MEGNVYICSWNKKGRKYGIVKISGNGGFGDLLNSDMLPERPVCPFCKTKRFVPMPVAPEYDMLCSSDGAVMGKLGPVFSDHFFSLFTEEELAKFNLRKINGPKRYKRTFNEKHLLS